MTQKICAPEIAQIFIHFHAMKKVHNSLIWAIVGLFALAFNPAAKAQDDLYYDPATDAPASTPATHAEEYDEDNNITRRYDDDNDYYEDDDDYAYEYSSRVRRFHRHSYGVDYYDPFFVDLYNYDTYYSPGTSIYVYNYNDYWSYRRWQRWQRWNAWNSFDYGYGGGWNTWGWNSAYSYNSPWYNPWVVNNYYYDPYWTCNGYNPYYHDYYGNGWSNNHYYYNNNNGGGGGGYSPQTYTGPRRNGSHVNPGYARIPDGKGRLATAEANVPIVERAAPRPGRTAGDIEGNTAVGRGKTAADRSVSPTTGGRRPEGSTTDPAATRTRTTETAPRGGGVETPAPRKDEGYKPRRSEEAPARPQRTETPTRRNDNDGGVITPRRTESTPSSREESRPVRRTEERSMDRPSRSTNNGGGGSSQESRPSRSSDSGSTSSGNSSGSSTRSSDSGSSKSSSSGSSSKSSGRGGRN